MDAEAPPSPEPAAQEPVEPVFEPQPAEPPPPPPPVEPEDGFEMPEFSIRVDPFNWLLEGRLGLELEVDTWEFISVELVPEFVANSSPPTFNLGSFPAELKQKSNGLGPVSGAALSVGFWLDGKPLEGTVLRVVFANRGYEYSTENEQGTIDRLTHTDRRVFGFVGSHARWGAFTIAGGIGLGVELNNQQRCIDDLGDASATCSKDVLEIRADNGVPPSILDLNGSLHPAYLMGRFSLGVVL